jgi:cytochrome c nitrite reductase small subunit
MRDWTALGGIVLAVAIGTAVGIGGFTFVYAKGASYLTNDPVACANCHVMRGHLDGWLAGSHRAVAVCNDCHAPHDLVGKYTTKAVNGFWHSVAFTTGWFHEPIRVTPRNQAVTEQACRYCHEPITTAIDPHRGERAAMSCVRCHQSVGHLR